MDKYSHPASLGSIPPVSEASPGRMEPGMINSGTPPAGAFSPSWFHSPSAPASPSLLPRVATQATPPACKPWAQTKMKAGVLSMFHASALPSFVVTLL